MPKFIAVKRNADKMSKYIALTEKLYRDDYTAEQIAEAINNEFSPLPEVTALETDKWIKEYGLIRKPEPRRGERLTPEPAVAPTSEPWEPMWTGWMHEVSP